MLMSINGCTPIPMIFLEAAHSAKLLGTLTVKGLLCNGYVMSHYMVVFNLSAFY